MTINIRILDFYFIRRAVNCLPSGRSQLHLHYRNSKIQSSDEEIRKEGNERGERSRERSKEFVEKYASSQEGKRKCCGVGSAKRRHLSLPQPFLQELQT